MAVQSWKQQKDEGVVKQDLDYSCGASSLATVLTYFYQKPTSERQILDDMALSDAMASFADLAAVSQKYGFVAKGVATDYDTLAKLQIPAIVYLQHRRSDHFSVVRAIDGDKVHLADSSWGNRTLSRRQFENMWRPKANAKLQGRVLLVLPTDTAAQTDANFRRVRDAQRLLRETPELFRAFL